MTNIGLLLSRIYTIQHNILYLYLAFNTHYIHVPLNVAIDLVANVKKENNIPELIWSIYHLRQWFDTLPKIIRNIITVTVEYRKMNKLLRISKSNTKFYFTSRDKLQKKKYILKPHLEIFMILYYIPDPFIKRIIKHETEVNRTDTFALNNCGSYCCKRTTNIN